MRMRPLAMVFLAATLAPLPSAAVPVELGFSGIHAITDTAWSALNDAGKLALIEQRADLAVANGATLVRLGGTDPQLFTVDGIHSGAFRKWTFVDAVVGVFTARDLDLCVTLPENVAPADLSPYVALVAAMAERYDGDGDFGVAEGPAINYEFPDIDGSGSITQSDWNADGAKRSIWAKAHRIACIEIGNEPIGFEDAGALAAGGYAKTLKAAATAVDDAQSDILLMLGGTRMDGQSKQDFVGRLESLPDSQVFFGALNAHIRDSTDGAAQKFSAKAVEKLKGWSADVDHPDAALWVGEVAFGSALGGTGEGPCVTAPCSLQTQSEGLIRFAFQAVEAGATTLLYKEPIELTGSGASDGPGGSTGLMVLDLKPGIDPSILPIAPRPALAVWRWLGSSLGGLEPTDLTPITGLPQNITGYAVGTRGIVLWFDWFQEAAPGAEYAGAQKVFPIDALAGPSVLVQSLWPDGLPGGLPADGSLDVTWPSTLLRVEGGSAMVTIGREPLWLTQSDEVIPDPVAEVEDVDADTAGGDTGTSAEPVPPLDDEGCGASPQGTWPMLVLGGLALAMNRRRKAGPQRA